MTKFLNRAALAAAAATLSGGAFAVGTDYSSLTSAVDFSTVGTALLAIGAVIMVPKVVKWGVRKVLSMIAG